jgi:hypothetical protein
MSRRKRATTPREDRIIVRNQLRNPAATPKEVRQNLYVCLETVRRRLDQFGLHCRVMRKKPLLTQKNMRRRRSYAAEFINFQSWDKVVFSDEKKWNLRGSDGRHYVRRRDCTALDRPHIKTSVKHSGSIMVWACFSATGPGTIVMLDKSHSFKAIDYELTLENAMLPSLEEAGTVCS